MGRLGLAWAVAAALLSCVTGQDQETCNPLLYLSVAANAAGSPAPTQYCSGFLEGYGTVLPAGDGSWYSQGNTASVCHCDVYCDDTTSGGGCWHHTCVSQYKTDELACFQTVSDCTRCPAGQFNSQCGCTKDTWQAETCRPDGTCVRNACQAGSCQACPADASGAYASFSPGGSATACTKCATSCGTGMYMSSPCSGTADIVCSSCPAGSFCRDGVSQQTCLSGFYCPAGTAIEIQCGNPSNMPYGVLTSDFCPFPSMPCQLPFCSAGSTFASAATTQCTACAPGTYSPSDARAAGSYNNIVGGVCAAPTLQNLCLTCPPGTYASAPSSTACHKCGQGKYGTVSGDVSSATCVSCAPGTYNATFGASACTACAAGTYLSKSGQQWCLSCAAGTYSSAAGATVCAQCDPGKYMAAGGNTSCVDCAAGTSTVLYPSYSGAYATGTGGQSACTACAAGYYATAGGTGCVQCDGVRFYCAGSPPSNASCSAPAAGQYTKTACSTGANAVIGTCRGACGAGQWQSADCANGHDRRCSACTDCRGLVNGTVNFQTYTVAPCNATANSLCGKCGPPDVLPGGRCNPCPAGTVAGGGVCVQCPAGTLSNGTAPACSACPAGDTSGPGAGACTVACGAGRFAPDGRTCRNISSGATRPVAWNSSLAGFVGAAVTLPSGAMVAAWSQHGGTMRGQLLQVGAGWSQVIAGMQAPGGLVGGDSLGLAARFSVIGSVQVLNQSRPDVLVVTDYYCAASATACSGQVRLVTVNQLAPGATYVHTLRASGLQKPVDAAAAPGGGSIWVMDSTASCIMAVYLNPDLTASVPAASCVPWSAGWLSNPAAVKVSQDGVGPDAAVLDGSSVYAVTLSGPSRLTPVVGPGHCSAAMPVPTAGTTSVPAASLCTSGAGVVDVALARGQIYLLFGANPAWAGVGVLNQATATVLIISASASTVPAGPSPTRFALSSGILYIVQGGGAAAVLQFEAGGLAACGPGLYALDGGDCVQAPAGYYAPDWSEEPMPCPPGTVGPAPGAPTAAAGCVPCPSQYTTYVAGSVSCLRACPTPQIWDAAAGACKAGCNATAGFYFDAHASSCVPCWAGSAPSPDADLCTLCPEGTAGTPRGLCAPCPPGTTTADVGATQCTPVADLPPHWVNDGIGAAASWSVPAAAAPAPASPGVAVTSGGEGALVGAGPSLWSIAAGAPPLLVASWPAPAARNGGFDLLQVADAQDYVYAAAVGGSCVHRLAVAALLQQQPSQQPPATPFAGGTCGNPQSGALGSVQSLALAERDGYVSVLFVSSFAGGAAAGLCSAVYAVSTFDGTVTTFAHPDVTTDPVVVLLTCVAARVLLASARGTGSLVAVGPNSSIYVAEGALGDGGGAAGPNGTDAFLQGFAQPYAQLPSGAAAAAVAALADRVVVLLSGGGGLIGFGSDGSAASAGAAGTGLAAAGRRVWSASQSAARGGLTVTQGAAPGASGCAGGFVSTLLHPSDPSAVCVQVGRGHVGLFDGSVSRCPAGTYGSRAGAYSLAAHCVPCPRGYVSGGDGSTECTPCQYGQLATPDSTACGPLPCPAGSYADAPSSQCVPCGPGHSSPAGSDSPTSCSPCAPGQYANATTGGACAACPAGYTSPAAATHCVASCGEGMCASDGVACEDTSLRYQVLTQLSVPGSYLSALTVDTYGGVFYSDGAVLRYYLDVCGPETQDCDLLGSDLLPPGASATVPGYQGSFIYSNLQIGALGICEVMVAQTGAADAAACPWVRKLYLTSLLLNCVLSLDVCMTGPGAVSVAATAARRNLAPVAGMPGSGPNQFRDGPAAQALFYTPLELEVSPDGGLVYISDFLNNRVRVLDTVAATVSTLVGSAGGGCWSPGLLACPAAVGQACRAPGQCAAADLPSGMGLSPDGATLYLSANSLNALMSIRGVRSPANATMTQICGYSATSAANGDVEMCSLSAGNSKGCAMQRPFDVVVFGRTAFVGWTQGLTAVNLDTLTCGQIAGLYFAAAPGNNDGIGPNVTSAGLKAVVSRVDYPLRLSMAQSKGVLYFADYNNGAVRRIQVVEACSCPPGYTYLPDASTCYNPSPRWQDGTLLPPCQPGYYALPGDAACTRPCDGAAAGGALAGACIAFQSAVSAAITATTDQPFSKVLANPEPGGAMPLADWYGGPPAGTGFDEISARTLYTLGRAPGRAPRSGEYASARYYPLEGCWRVDPSSPPTRVLPGLWFQCGPAPVSQSTCACPNNVAEFGGTDTSPSWETLRLRANTHGARSLAPTFANFGCGTPQPPAPRLASLVTPPPDQAAAAEWSIELWSRFVMMGTPNASTVPGICGPGGSCFVGWAHFQASPPTDQLGQNYDSTKPVCVEDEAAADAALWGAAGVQSLACYAGWPAHYSCPDGFAWVGPGSPLAADMCEGQAPPEMVTCVSCMPGYSSSSAVPSAKALDGGPYACEACASGYYSSDAGATACTACPEGTYGQGPAATACTACSNTTTTGRTGAPSVEYCLACNAGTGSCTSCLWGSYQVQPGQVQCAEAQPGCYSDTVNATACTACAPGYYQNLPGQTACLQCAPDEYTSATLQQGAGAVACLPCNDQSCPLALDNTCGKGCGPNMYWDATGGCTVCPSGTFSPLQACALDVAVCALDPRRDYIMATSASAPTLCPDGTMADTHTYSTCINCTMGWYSRNSVGTKGCVKCDAGSISAAGGATACSLCDAGTFGAVPGLTACAQCNTGLYSPGPGYSACLACAPGKYSPDQGSVVSCDCCPNGTFTNTSGRDLCNERCVGAGGYYTRTCASACSFCAGGLVAVGSGACLSCGLGDYVAVSSGGTRYCAKCPPGTVSLGPDGGADLSACVPCPGPLEYAAANASECINASDGFVPNPGLTGQQACDVGTYRLGLNMTACTGCPLGAATDQQHTTACAQCRPGRFAPVTGLSVCQNCPTGTVSTSMGMTSCSNCDAGKYSSAQTGCVACGANTFSVPGRDCQGCDDGTVSDAGSSTCTQCSPGTIYTGMLATASCEVCPMGTYYYYDTDGPICESCGVGKYLPRAGGNSSADCMPCHPGLVSLYVGASACTQCQAGSKPSDALTCGPCDPGTGGVGCMPCSRGTFAAQSGASVCAPCPAGSYSGDAAVACAPCPAGTYAASRGSSACTPCPGATNFSGPGQSNCTARKVSCAVSQYILPTQDPAVDNGCAQCVACNDSQVAVFQQNQQPYALLSVSMLMSSLCNGTGIAPLYQCFSSAVVAGTHLAYYGQNVGASAAGSFSSSTTDPWQLSMCPALSAADQALVAYVSGPSPLYCYVSCLYGTLTLGPAAYAQQTASDSGLYPSNVESPADNLFFARLVTGAVDMAPSVCAPCAATACTTPGAYRPAFPTAGSPCGPPCGLPASSGAANPYEAVCAGPGRADGCVGTCTNLPGNATFTSGSPRTGDPGGCGWVCNKGSHISETGAGCLPCALPDADAVADFCQGSDYAMVPPAQCGPLDTRATLCKSCKRVGHAEPPAWDPVAKACVYTCQSGYYLAASANGTLCAACADVDPNTCGAGAYLDVATCVQMRTAPACQHCELPPADELMDARYYAYTTNGGTNASGCRARCSVGLHTVQRSTGQYYNLYDPAQAMGPPAGDLQCVLCTLNDDRACASRGCPGGYWRNSSVPDGQPRGCIPCTGSGGCPLGTHALLCAGNETSDPGCIPCPPIALGSQMQPIPYSAARRDNIIETVPGGCPVACINNFVLASTRDACVSCGRGCLHAGVQPEICDFRYAHWNATPGAPWWDPAYTPPLLLAMSELYRWGPLWPRAGLCWACPPGTDTGPDDADLCVVMSGYSVQAVHALAQPPIPSVPEGFAVLFDEPRPPLVRLQQQGGSRRLLGDAYVAPWSGANASNYTVTVNATATAYAGGELAPVMPCPTGTYKPGRGDGLCYQCPQQSSTVGPAADSPDNCICHFGSTRLPLTGVCELCPEDTAGSTTAPGGACTPCPANETTFGLSGQTACACKIGTYRSGGGACQPCPQDYYCVPCYRGETDCPSAGVRVEACFLGSSSPPGSFTEDNCTCPPGQARLARPGTSLLYCAALPQGSGVNLEGDVVCLPGWTAVAGGQVLQCRLCGAGYYAEADPSDPTSAVLDGLGRPACSPCPAGTYSSSTTAIGAQCCQLCPPLQSTRSAASTSRSQCACPATMGVDPVTGLCVGCTPAQYQDPSTGACQDCPPDSVATAGAISADGCACTPGHEPSSDGACVQCKLGYYSGTSGRVPCTRCPQGSTTLSVGSSSRLACGASASLCLGGYVWRAGLGCFKT